MFKITKKVDVARKKKLPLKQEKLQDKQTEQ